MRLKNRRFGKWIYGVVCERTFQISDRPCWVGVKEIDEMGYEMTRGLSPRPAVVVDGTDEWQLAVTDLILEAGFELKGRATRVDFEMMAWSATVFNVDLQGVLSRRQVQELGNEIQDS